MRWQDEGQWDDLTLDSTPSSSFQSEDTFLNDDGLLSTQDSSPDSLFYPPSHHDRLCNPGLNSVVGMIGARMINPHSMMTFSFPDWSDHLPWHVMREDFPKSEITLWQNGMEERKITNARREKEPNILVLGFWTLLWSSLYQETKKVFFIQIMTPRV